MCDRDLWATLGGIMTPKLRLMLLAIAVASAGVYWSGLMATFAQSAAPWTLTLNSMQVPAAEGSGPQLRSSSRGVILSWVESNDAGTSLKIAKRTTSQWTSAMTVAAGEDWFVTDADR